jgi:thrombospondin 2/3/4/5
MIDFPAARNKFSFYLDRKGKRITIDINSNDKTFSKQLNVPMLNETATIRSLAISFSQNVVTLYLDCQDVLKDEMEFNLSKLFLDMEDPSVKLFRERKYPLFLDGSIESALDRASCQKFMSKRKWNKHIVKNNEGKDCSRL